MRYRSCNLKLQRDYLLKTTVYPITPFHVVWQNNFFRSCHGSTTQTWPDHPWVPYGSSSQVSSFVVGFLSSSFFLILFPFVQFVAKCVKNVWLLASCSLTTGFSSRPSDSSETVLKFSKLDLLASSSKFRLLSAQQSRLISYISASCQTEYVAQLWPSIKLNVADNENKFWKTVMLTSFQIPQFLFPF